MIFDEFSILFRVIGIIINVFICFNVLWGMLMIDLNFFPFREFLIDKEQDLGCRID